MEAATSTLIFHEKAMPFSELDGLFKKFIAGIPDGYALVKDEKGAIRYLFVIDGKPYAAAAIDSEGKRLTKLGDFFLWYKGAGKADVTVFKADRKFLLCVLVNLKSGASESFSADAANLEDVMKKLESQKKDCVWAFQAEGNRGFALFIKGRPVYVFIPGKKALNPGESPADELISYCYGLSRDKPLTIDMHFDIKVSPAEDAVTFPEEGLASRFVKLIAAAYVELVEEGIVKGTFPVNGNLTIGRETTSDVHLAEAGVSRHHAVIKFLNGKFVLHDLKSANGTFFKGVRFETKDLHDGDEINIRKYVLRFHGPAVSQASEKREKPMEDLAAQTVYAEEAKEAAAAQKAAPIRGAVLEMEGGATHRLASITTIGKDDNVDILVEGMLVAKRHAVIVRGKDVYKLIKKGALSSIKVNGEKVDEVALKDGDVIEIGNQKMTFRAGRAEG
ncbi:MAG TPA: FHA domain-containing protein [Thermodesulfobacteriota bacterium]|nr:FHA domain-containing protein [Thermodesulfobacteriota bacterium]